MPEMTSPDTTSPDMTPPDTTPPDTAPMVRYPDRLHRFPAIEDVRQRGLLHLPGPVRAFLECGSGDESCLVRNRSAFNDVTFTPRYIRPDCQPRLITDVFGHRYQRPFGIAPVGMADFIWPGTESILRQTANRRALPLVMSMMGSTTLEQHARETEGLRWLHVYPMRDRNLLDDMFDRAERNHYDVLVLTIDCPALGRRESMRRAGFSMLKPQFKDPRFLTAGLLHPHWFWRMCQQSPKFCTPLAPYTEDATQQSIGALIRRQLPAAIDWDGLRRLRDRWPRYFVVKGVVNAVEAQELANLGIDAIWVSNHGGRQLDSVPSSLDILRSIRTALGSKLPIFLDSGVRSGLDIVRALSLGADFVFLGRPFLYGTAAFNEEGGDIVIDILTDELLNTLKLLGIESVSAGLYP